ncbi:hypothetical protein MKY04_12540 [Lysinibacillus telephonicus]|uniref:hypothetical protein n=1 Tax=Lysinibacillus telephonicus TaxID=1714840 RepID=UPI0031FCE944
MATNTTNYNLIKPDVDDFYDVNQFNQNADIIDTQLKNNADSIKAILTNDLTALPPVDATLNSGENTLTTEHDSTARVTAFEGDTIVNDIGALFDSGAWGFSSDFVVNSPSKVTLTVSDGANHGHYVVFPVKANTDYTFNVKHNASIAIYKVDGTPIQNYTSDQVITFNTGTETNIRIYFRNPNLTNGTFTFEEPMLNEGTEPKPFVANVQGITNPTIDNPTTGDSITLLGTFHKGDVVSEDKGQYSVLRAKKEVSLGGSEGWTYSTKGATGWKRVTTPISGGVYGSQKVVKYNGAILSDLPIGGTWENADSTVLFTDNLLYISIANTDSGWGDSYTPTADEIKAYFLGWQMSSTNTASPTPYNGTGTKYWRAISVTPVDGNQYTTTLPTTQAPISGKWQPYKLVFDLASPVREPIQAINSVLKLAKGDNALQVSEGRIVREKANVAYDSNNAFINSIHPGYEQSRLKYKTSKILSVYKNGELDTNWIHQSDSVTYGNDKVYIPIANFDKIAVYTVDYEPLYPFEVTAPTNPITIEYQSNLASVVGQNVEDIVELKNDVAVIERDMVRKGEGVEWLTPVLLNGVTGDVKISKDVNNIVEIRAQLTLPGALSTSTPLFFVPKEFKPPTVVPQYFNCIEYTTNTDSKTTVIGISPNDGGIRPGFATTKNILIINARYRAGQ